VGCTIAVGRLAGLAVRKGMTTTEVLLAHIIGADVGVVTVLAGSTTTLGSASIVQATVAARAVAGNATLAQTAGFAVCSLGLAHCSLTEIGGLAILITGT
jgi:hypothetical protein